MVLGIVSSAASTAPPFKVTLNLQSHAERVLCQVKNMQWVLLSLDLIGAGAVVAALTSGIFFWQFLRQMKRLGD
jgi:hypothetical protein